jgi:hypothetical protein
MTPHRFPPSWSVEELNACFVVRDDNGQKLAYVYFEDEPGRGRRRICSPETRPGASQPMWPSCRSFCRSRNQISGEN